MSNNFASESTKKSKNLLIRGIQMTPEDAKALGQRIAQSSELVGGKRALAGKIGVSETQIYRYIKGENVPSLEVILNITKTAGVSVEWLATGAGEMRPSVKVLRSGAAQYRLPLIESFDDKLKILSDFKEAFIRENPSLDLTKLSMDCVQNDTMEPTLSDGDLIFIDPSVSQLQEAINGIYVYSVGNGKSIARLQRLPDGIVQFSFDNQRYQPFTINLAQPPKAFTLLGRVIWSGGNL